jgi:hypothetical protein
MWELRALIYFSDSSSASLFFSIVLSSTVTEYLQWEWGTEATTVTSQLPRKRICLAAISGGNIER